MPAYAVPMSDAADALAPYDVVLLGSFGGPEAPDEVVPFLRSVTAGRGIPDERLEAVGEHYYARRRPQPDQRPEPRAAGAPARRARPARHPTRRCSWGNRNFGPCVADVLREARDHGATRVVTLLTSAYSSYSSCRQYREDLAAAVDAVGPLTRAGQSTRCARMPVPRVPRPQRRLRRGGPRPARPAPARLLFVTHSLPETMNDMSGPGRRRGPPLHGPAPGPSRGVTDALERELGLEPPERAGLLLPVGPAGTSRGSNPTSTTGCASSPRRTASPCVLCADRVRVRPHGGRLRPRHRGGRDGRRRGHAVRPGPDGRAPTRSSSPAWSTCWSSGPPRPAACPDTSLPATSPVGVRDRVLPQPAHPPAGPLRAATDMAARAARRCRPRRTRGPGRRGRDTSRAVHPRAASRRGLCRHDQDLARPTWSPSWTPPPRRSSAGTCARPGPTTR